MSSREAMDADLGPVEGPPDSLDAVHPSWAPVDLSEALWNPQPPVRPTLLPRSDGVALVYPGLVHSFHGESESGKSLILQGETARLLTLGKSVLYIDFESDPASVIERLRRLNVDPSTIKANLHYIRPDGSPRRSLEEWAAWEALLAGSYELAVIDGVTDALTMYGYSSIDNDDVTRWHREMPRKIADRTGAAVVLIDHLTVISVDPPSAADGSHDNFRPTGLMEKVSRAVESDAGLTQNQVVARVVGKKPWTIAALRLLIQEGYVATESGPNNSKRHSSASVYRETDDPLSDKFEGRDPLSAQPGSRSGSQVEPGNPAPPS